MYIPQNNNRFVAILRSALGVSSITAAGLISFSPVAHGQLKLDFQPTGGTTAAGYQEFGVANQANPSSSSQIFNAFDTSITVNLTSANLPDGNLDFRAVARNGAATDVYNDWIGVDTRGAIPGNDVTLSLQFFGLPTGVYSWLSFHEDGGTGALNGNLTGQADFSFTDASGVAVGLINFSSGSDTTLGTFSTTFTSDGVNPVSFSMMMDFAQGGTTANSLFAFIGGVEITAVPEPSSMMLLGLGIAGIAFWRFRK